MPKSVPKKTFTAKKSITILISIFVIVIIVAVGLFLRSGELNKNYVGVYLDPLPTDKTYGEDFTLQSEFKLAAPKDNTAFSADKALPTSAIRNAAFKLGFTTESSNTSTGIYIFSKSLDISGNRILLDVKKGTVSMATTDGLEANTEDKNELYKFVADFLGLSTLDIATVNKVENNGVANYSYQVSYKGRPVIFAGQSSVIATIDTKDKKVINAFMYIISSSNLVPFGEIRPIKSINNTNLKDLIYTAKATPEQASNGPLGADTFVVGSLLTSLKDYSECYYYYFEEVGEKVMLLPALKITGEYIAQDDLSKGKFDMVVVNEETVY